MWRGRIPYLPARFGYTAERLAKWKIPESKSKRVFGQSRKRLKMLRAGLYARVSTLDQQTLPVQMRALREYAAKRGWTVVEECKEVAGARAMRQRLNDSAPPREIDVRLVWRLDRWCCLCCRN